MIKISEIQHDNVGIGFLSSHLLLLRTCRRVGTKKGIEFISQMNLVTERLAKMSDTDKQEDLVVTLESFVHANIFEKYEILTKHPELLSVSADDVMFVLFMNTIHDEDEDTTSLYEKNRILLQNCREKGIDQGFSQLLVLPEQSGLPNPGVPLRYTLKLIQLSNGLQVDDIDSLSKSFSLLPNILDGTRNKVSSFLEPFDPQMVSFMEKSWNYILNNPEFADADSDIQSFIWRVAGAFFDYLYETTSNRIDLDRSVELFGKAVKSGSLLPQDLNLAYISLSNALDRRYQDFGLTSDLDESIQSVTSAIEVARENKLDELGISLSILGDSLRKLFWQTNKTEHLIKAISVLQEATELLENNSEKSSNYYEALNNLSSVYGDLFEITGRFEYLSDAIRNLEIGVGDLPQPPYLNNLGNLLMDSYDYAGKISDLDKAIDKYEKALKGISLNHRMTPSIYGNLGRAFVARCFR